MRARPATGLPPFEAVVATHGPAVLRFCAARAGSERAEDCFQDAMLSALRAYDSLRDPAAIESWLFSIAARKVIDAQRAGARQAEPVDDLAALAGPAAEPHTDNGLFDQVRELPEKQRFAVTLRFVADMSHREIAQVMQISEPAARRNLFEGLKRLRVDLTPADLASV